MNLLGEIIGKISLMSKSFPGVCVLVFYMCVCVCVCVCVFVQKLLILKPSWEGMPLSSKVSLIVEFW